MFSKCLRIVSCRFEKMHSQVFEACCRCVLGIWDLQSSLLLQNTKVLSYFSYLVSSCEEFKEMLSQLNNCSLNPGLKILSNSLSFFNIPGALQPYIEFTLKSRDSRLMDQYVLMLVERLNIPRQNHGDSFFVDLVRYCLGSEQYELNSRLMLTRTCLSQVKDQFWLSQVMFSIYYEWIIYDNSEEPSRLQLGWALMSQREEPKLAIQSLDFLLSLVKQFSPGNNNTQRSVHQAFQQFRGHITMFMSSVGQIDKKLAQKLSQFLHRETKPNQAKQQRKVHIQEQKTTLTHEERKSLQVELTLKYKDAIQSKEKYAHFLEQLTQSKKFLEKQEIKLIAKSLAKADQISYSLILEHPSEYFNSPETALFDMIFNKQERKHQREFLFIQKLFCYISEIQDTLCPQLYLYSLIRAKSIQKKELGQLCLKLSEQMIHSAKRNVKEIIKNIIQELVTSYSYKAIDLFVVLLAETQAQICADNDILLSTVLEYCSAPTLIHLTFMVKIGELVLFEKTLLSVMKHSLNLLSNQQHYLWQLINAHHSGSFKIKDDLLKCVVHILSSEIIMEDQVPEKAAIFTLNATTLIEKFRREKGKTFSLQAISDIKESFPLFYQAIKIIIS